MVDGTLEITGWKSSRQRGGRKSRRGAQTSWFINVLRAGGFFLSLIPLQPVGFSSTAGRRKHLRWENPAGFPAFVKRSDD